VRPDFYFTLHNYAGMGGVWFIISRDIGDAYYEPMRDLAAKLGMRLKSEFAFGTPEFGLGVSAIPTVRSLYDYLVGLGLPIPGEMAQGNVGAASYEYLEEIEPSALTFVSEPSYGRHSGDGSQRETQLNLRLLNLRVDAHQKYIATVILEEWDRTHADLDVTSAFYRKLAAELVSGRDTLHEGITAWYVHPIQEMLFNPALSRPATEGDLTELFGMHMTLFLGNAYTFVRLLEASRQTDRVRVAIGRLERVFDEALAEMWRYLDFGAYEAFDCDSLVRMQLGSGLIALNSLLASA
jgi:hypothetical protein